MYVCCYDRGELERSVERAKRGPTNVMSSLTSLTGASCERDLALALSQSIAP